MLRTMDMLDEGVVRCPLHVLSMWMGVEILNTNIWFSKFWKYLLLWPWPVDTLRYYTLHFHSKTNSPGNPQQHRRTYAEDAVGACSNVQRGVDRGKGTISDYQLEMFNLMKSNLSYSRRVWLTFFLLDKIITSRRHFIQLKHWRELEKRACWLATHENSFSRAWRVYVDCGWDVDFTCAIFICNYT